MAPLVLAIAMLLQQEPPEESPRPPDVPGRTAKTDREEPLEALIRFLTHPFVDNGRRFDAYPYASDGPYYTRVRFSDKTYAGLINSTFGRVEHDLWSVGLEAMLAWSSGCDVRIDGIVFEEDLERGTAETRLHHVHLDIGGYEGPRTIDYSVGFGFGVLEDEESTEFGPSLRAGFLWFPGRPVSIRLSGTCSFFDGDAVGDLRFELGLHLGPIAWVAGVRSVLKSGGEDLTGPTLGIAAFF